MEAIIGPRYSYPKAIKTPKEMGVNTNGSWTQFATNLAGIGSYLGVMITGDGMGGLVPVKSNNGAGGPLGNKFFMKTQQTCVDVATGKDVKRSIYVNNVTDVGPGLNGLVPGVIENAVDLGGDVGGLFTAFIEPSKPKCKRVSKQVSGSGANQNSVSMGSGYLTLEDIKNLDGFANFQEIDKSKLPNDPILMAYITSISLLLMYITFRIMQK